MTVNELMTRIHNAESSEQIDTAVELYENGLKRDSATISDTKWLEVLFAIVNNPKKLFLRLGEDVAEEMKWKKLPDSVSHFIDKLLSKSDKLKRIETEEWEKREPIYDGFEELCGKVCEMTKDIVSGKRAAKKACQLLTAAVRTPDPFYAACISDMMDLINWNNQGVNQKLKLEFATAVTRFYMSHPNLDWFEAKERKYLVRNVLPWMWSAFYGETKLALCIFTLKRVRILPPISRVNKSTAEQTFKLFDWLQTRELTDKRGANNDFGQALFQLVYSLLVKHRDKASAIALKQFIPHCVQWMQRPKEELEEDLQNIAEGCSAFVDNVLRTAPELLSEQMASLVQLYHVRPNPSLLLQLSQAYGREKSATAEIEKSISQFLQLLQEPNMEDQRPTLLQLIQAVAARSPQLVAKHVEEIEALFSDENCAYSACSILGSLAEKQPAALEKRGEAYFDELAKGATPAGALSNLLVSVVFSHMALLNESEAERIVGLEEQEARKLKMDENFLLCLLYTWSFVAHKFKQPLLRRRAFLEELIRAPKLKQSAQHILDILDGRSLKKISENVAIQQEDISKLDERVDDVEEDVEIIEKTTMIHEKNIISNQSQIQKADQKLSNLEDRVDFAEDDIGELENRTVSNAPKWAKQVSKLLNPFAPNDWRLVAKRLNYSREDIVGWAQQADPAMSLLAELYTTHKTAEANNFLLSVCRDVDRTDVVQTIEKAIKNEQYVAAVADQPAAAPPQVFLSYQWGHQSNVKLLKNTLKEEGLDCWMDVGQMGGGDSLYGQIDKGIRGAKVVVLCLSEKYLKSANCVREANLANGLAKPTIPLLMEKVSWPPAGSLGPILADKLYIQFYPERNPGKSAAVLPWPDGKFKELLSRLQEFAKPNRQHKRGTAADDASEQPKKTNEPLNLDVVISCGTDRIAQMTALERLLQARGYRTKVVPFAERRLTWLPARLVICAVTAGYAQSPQAMNELKQAAQNSRIILPILLEKVRFMSPSVAGKKHVVAPLVDCCRVNFLKSQGNNLAELFSRLEQLLLAEPKKNVLPALTRRSSDIAIRIRPPSRKQRASLVVSQPAAGRLTPDRKAANAVDEDTDESWSSTDDEDEHDIDKAKHLVRERNQKKPAEPIFRLPKIPEGAKRVAVRPVGGGLSNLKRRQSLTGGVARANKFVAGRASNRTGRRLDLNGPKLPSVYRQRRQSSY